MLRGFGLFAAFTVCFLVNHSLARAPEAKPVRLPPRVNVALESKDRWQRLPLEVIRATVDARQRLWVTTRSQQRIEDLAQAKEIIAREYPQEWPQLPSGMGLVHVEKEGRHWFTVSFRPSEDVPFVAQLIGYDGKTFVVRRGGTAELFLGPVITITTDRGPMVCFAATQTLHCYANGEWSSFELPRQQGASGEPMLRATPDGRSLVFGYKFFRNKLWRFAGAGFTAVETGLTGTGGEHDTRTHVSFAPMRDGIYLACDSGLYVIPYDGKSPAKMDVLVARLRDKDSGVRDAAQEEIVQRVDAAAVREAIAASGDAEVKAMLRRALERIEERRGRAFIPETVLGDYKLRGVQRIIALENGSVIIIASSLLNRADGTPVFTAPESAARYERALGAIQLDAEGKVRVVGDHTVAVILARRDQRSEIRLAPDNDNILWCNSYRWNLPDKKIDLPLEHPLLSYQGQLRDGTVLCADKETMWLYRPSRPDTRVVLRQRTTLEGGRPVLTPDGNIWFVSTSKDAPPVYKLNFYDGRNVTTFVQPLPAQWTNMTLGLQGVIYSTQKGWRLATPEKTVEADTLDNLLRDNRVAVAQIFGPECVASTPFLSTGPFIHVDAKGNTWLLRATTMQLMLFDGETWRDLEDQLLPANFRRDSPGYMRPLGKSGAMLVGEYGSTGPGRSAIVRWQDGKLQLQKIDVANASVVYQEKDPASPRSFAQGRFWEFDNSACPVVLVGEDLQPRKTAFYNALFLDARGELWHRGPPETAFRVQAGGREFPSVPSLAWRSQFATFPSGATYFSFPVGLIRLHPSDSAAASWYRFENNPHHSTAVAVSSHGFLALLPTAAQGLAGQTLIFDVPNELLKPPISTTAPAR